MTDNKTNDYRQRVQEMEAKLNDPGLTDEQTLGDALLSFRPDEHGKERPGHLRPGQWP